MKSEEKKLMIIDPLTISSTDENKDLKRKKIKID